MASINQERRRRTVLSARSGPALPGPATLWFIRRSSTSLPALSLLATPPTAQSLPNEHQQLLYTIALAQYAFGAVYTGWLLAWRRFHATSEKYRAAAQPNQIQLVKTSWNWNLYLFSSLTFTIVGLSSGGKKEKEGCPGRHFSGAEFEGRNFKMCSNLGICIMRCLLTEYLERWDTQITAYYRWPIYYK